MVTTPTRIELGCGSHKRPGFYGLDVQAGPEVDLVLDVEREPLPFPDNSVEYIYSSHAFEHLEAPGSPIQTLREIVRVAKDGAVVEVWTPYGKNNDAFLFGHRIFYTETHWKHICFEYDDFYLGSAPGRFVWERTEYTLYPNILEELSARGIAVDFAVEHMFNIVHEFGVFLRVDKKASRAQRPQIPVRQYSYRRGELLQVPSEQRAPSRGIKFPSASHLLGRALRKFRAAT